MKEKFPATEKIKVEDRAKGRSTAVDLAANFDFLFVARFYENPDPPFAPLDITPLRPVPGCSCCSKKRVIPRGVIKCRGITVE